MKSQKQRNLDLQASRRHGRSVTCYRRQSRGLPAERCQFDHRRQLQADREHKSCKTRALHHTRRHFDTIKIETSFTGRSRKDQTKKYQAVATDVTATEINLRINTSGQQPIQASAGAILSLTRYNAT